MVCGVACKLFCAKLPRRHRSLIMHDRDDFEDGEDRRLPREYLNSGGLRTAGFKAASMDQAIPSSNPGFQLLQKMGWNAGQGLGKKGQGRVDPVRLDANEFKMGLGKNSEYNYYAVEEATKVRPATRCSGSCAAP